MQRKLPILSFVAAFAASALFAAQEVTTPPVGFITVNIKGAGALSQRYNVVGVNMVNPVEFQGLSGSATTVSSKTQIALTGITAAAFPATNKYFLEIVSGTNEGVMIDIASVADGQVILAENVTSAFSSAVTVAIRKHNTIGSIFGSGTSLVLKDGEGASDADVVQIFNSATQSASVFYYDNLDGIWAQAGGSGDKSGTVVYPDQGLIVIRRGAADVSFKVVGSVKTGKTVVNIDPGYNVVTYPYPVEATVATTGFINANANTSLTGGETASDADQIQVFNATTQSAAVYYFDTLDTQWVQTGVAGDAGSIFKMPIGGSLIIKRGVTRSSVPVVLTQPF